MIMAILDERADLWRRAIRGTVIFSAVLLLLILVPAGSLRYWVGWLFWTHFTAWTGALTFYFLRHDPALVERRLRAGPAAECEPTQRRIQLFTSVAICAVFIASALDQRFQWSATRTGGVALGHALVAIGFLIIFRVFRENTFAAATIGVAAGQTVVASGPYTVVRHPMYAGALLMFIGTPLALGSWWGLLPVLFLAGGLVARLQDEEAYLDRNLAGYDAYRGQVRHRLIPGVW
jgi:protein-S-isoprenylcysteine O-methyltransferase Ste14